MVIHLNNRSCIKTAPQQTNTFHERGKYATAGRQRYGKKPTVQLLNTITGIICRKDWLLKTLIWHITLKKS